MHIWGLNIDTALGHRSNPRFPYETDFKRGQPIIKSLIAFDSNFGREFLSGKLDSPLGWSDFCIQNWMESDICFSMRSEQIFRFFATGGILQ